MHHSDRRNFLRTLVGGIAATAAVRTWPFRVYSFPTEIVSVPYSLDGGTTWTNFDLITAQTLAILRDEIVYDNFFVDTPWIKKLRRDGWKVRPPMRFHEALG